MSIDYLQTGVVTTYTDNSSGVYYPVINDSVVPSVFSGFYVSQNDFNKGVFFCSVGGEVRFSKYRDLTLSACCTFHNPVQMAQQQYTLSSIVNNTYNIVQNIINPPATATVDPNSIGAQFKTLTDNYSTLASNYQTLVTEVMTDESSAATVLNNVNNHSQSITDLQNKVALLAAIIKGLNIQNISNSTFQNGLI